MYEIHFYRERSGSRPVADYIRELAGKNDKDSRIKLQKIQDYINALSEYGLQLREPYIKHLDGEIWELRPLRDRILFVAWHNGSFVLLHHFMKKTQKTPAREIDKAKRELTLNNSALGGTWEELQKELFTPEEIAASNLRVALIGELIKARQERGISQKKLEELSGVKQPIIARMEKGTTNPQIDTILKVLAPLGKTLAIVPLDK